VKRKSASKSNSIRIPDGFLKRFIRALRTNYFLRVSIIMMFSLVGASLAFLFYLQTQYLQYLIENSTQTDKVLLNTEESTIRRNIDNVIQVGAKLSLNADLIESATALREDPDDTLSKLTLRHELEQTFKESGGELINVLIMTADGNVLFQRNRVIGNLTGTEEYWGGDNEQLLENLSDRLFDQLKQNTVPKCVWTTEPNQFIFHTQGAPVYTCRNMINIAFSLPGNTSPDQVDSILVLSFELSSVSAFFSQIAGMSNNYTATYITDQSGNLLYAPESGMVGRKLENVAPEGKYRIVSTEIDKTGWNLNIALDVERLNGIIRMRYRKGVTVLLLAILLISAVQFVMTRRALSPIRNIQKAMNSVRKGVWKTRIEIRGEDEIWKLAENYNEMADALEEWKEKNARQNEEQIQAVRKTADAQMHALESQINAHFLCNTLNAINMSAAEQGNEEVSEMLRKLSDIMRYAYSSSAGTVTLGDEVNWVMQYLALQKFRLMDRFDYRVEFQPQYLEWPCCKLFLQPFVENSIRHGFVEKEKDCFISVTGRMGKDGRMEILIEDNGCGMSADQSRAVQGKLSAAAFVHMEGTGIGLENVAARLRLFYGEKLEIRFWTEEGKGTQFLLELPLPQSLVQDDAEDVYL